MKKQPVQNQLLLSKKNQDRRATPCFDLRNLDRSITFCCHKSQMGSGPAQLCLIISLFAFSLGQSCPAGCDTCANSICTRKCTSAPCSLVCPSGYNCV